LLIVALAMATIGPAAYAADGECRLIRGAATIDDPTDDVQVCRQDVWLHKGDHQIANLGSTLPSWNTTAPTGSTQSAGVYYPVRLMDILEPYNPDYRPTFKGTFTGTLDTLGASIYVKLPVYEALSGNWPLLARLIIDGETVFEVNPFTNVPMQAAGNFRVIRFAFTNIYEAMKSMALDLSAEKQHEVELSLIQNFWGDGLPAGVFFDAAEVASGLNFNLESNKMSGFTKFDTSPPAE
jgi:hypothetical protein